MTHADLRRLLPALNAATGLEWREVVDPVDRALAHCGWSPGLPRVDCWPESRPTPTRRVVFRYRGKPSVHVADVAGGRGWAERVARQQG